MKVKKFVMILWNFENIHLRRILCNNAYARKCIIMAGWDWDRLWYSFCHSNYNINPSRYQSSHICNTIVAYTWPMDFANWQTLVYWIERSNVWRLSSSKAKRMLGCDGCLSQGNLVPQRVKVRYLVRYICFLKEFPISNTPFFLLWLLLATS